MNKKFIIQLVVIVGAFGGAGLVLYNGLFKQGGGGAQTPAVVPAATQESILPYGTSMDFNAVLKQRNLQYNLVAFPVLAPDSEVGIPPSALITPTVSTPPPVKK